MEGRCGGRGGKRERKRRTCEINDVLDAMLDESGIDELSPKITHVLDDIVHEVRD